MRILRWSHLTDVQRVREVVREWVAKGFSVTVGPQVRTDACVCRMVNAYRVIAIDPPYGPIPGDRPAESPAE
jgi:hypothetical protein